MQGTALLGSANLTNGMATFSTTGLAAGLDVITAAYSGNASFGPSVTPITPKSIIATVAGGGNEGDGGNAAAATLNRPFGVAVDASGDIFVADTRNNRIREASGGVIKTVAGNGGYGYSGDGGPATTAELANPAGIAIDASGDLFIADTGNNVVREVKLSTGVITTVAGDGSYGYTGDHGPATSAELANPTGVAADALGNIFIADTYNNVIREVAGSLITTIAGTGNTGYSGDGGPATSATLTDPSGVAVAASGSLFVADSGNNVIRKLVSGVITTIAGTGNAAYSGDGGQATGASLDFPFSVAVDSSGNIYIADSDDNAIREVSGSVITTVAGNGISGYNGDHGPATAAELSFPFGVAVSTSGNLFIADNANNVVREVSGGTIATVVGSGYANTNGDGSPATKAALYDPSGVAVDASGDLFIADGVNNRVREVNPVTGVITTVAGNGIYGYSGDSGQAIAAELGDPTAAAVDASGDLFIADSGNNVIRKVVLSTGVITTVAGNGSYGYSGDHGQAAAAELANPSGIAVDASGNLYIADTDNNVIREVSGGIITTVAGNGSAGYSGDNGQATSAELFSPFGVAVDASGKLFIADTGDSAIRKVSGGVITTVAGNGKCRSIQTSSVPARGRCSRR
jgi:sugar lactone lactonase YvrE